MCEPRLKNKVAIVTGAGQGLGEYLSYSLAKEMASVVVADINVEKARLVAERIKSEYNVESIFTLTDVTKEEDVVNMVKITVDKFNKIDILVSNAGILYAYDITEFPADVWRKVIDVNLYGYFLCAREVARVMVKQKSGSIIQINSKSGKKGSFRNSAYAASKFAGIGLTQSIALDLAPYNIRVNAVCPGNLLDSPLWKDSLYEQYARKWNLTVEEVRRKYESQVPLGRGCSYDDVSNVVIFLASDESSYITGQSIGITGGEVMW